MKCPNCKHDIDGYRGKFSVASITMILVNFYELKKSIYSITNSLVEQHVRTNKMAVKAVVLQYQNTWKEHLARHVTT